MGLEPTTTGITILQNTYFPALMVIDIIKTNQRFKDISPVFVLIEISKNSPFLAT